MIKEKHIVILGGNGLIGQKMVSNFLDQGANLSILDIRFSKDLENLEKKGIIKLESCDINSEKSLAKCIKSIRQISGAVNVSYPRNLSYGSKLEDVTLEEFNDNLRLLLGSAYNFMKVFYEKFRKDNKKISLVNFSSIYGVIPPKFSIYKNTDMTMPVEYAAAKSAIINLTKYFANYANNSAFKVNCISPGGVFAAQDEKFIDAYKKKTYGSGLIPVTQIANATAFLLSNKSNYINGQNIIIDDGFTNK